MSRDKAEASNLNFEFDEATDFTDDPSPDTLNKPDDFHQQHHSDKFQRVDKMTALTSFEEDDMEPQLDDQLDKTDAIFEQPFEEIPTQILTFEGDNDPDPVGGLEEAGSGASHFGNEPIFMHPGPSNNHDQSRSLDDIDDAHLRELDDVGESTSRPEAKALIVTEEKAQPLQLPQMMSPGAEDEDEEETQAAPAEGSYDPADYEHLDVGPELKELFSYIVRYTPQTIELEHHLRPYIPDYIPAVGDIDAFIKVPRPDGESSTSGLTVLDEPNARQSDPNVLDLQLRAVAKHTTARSMVVKRVENGEKNAKVVEKWIKDISELHRAKPPPTVHYSKRMPDIDSLMQEWPGDVEELLKETSLPSAALQVELPHFVDVLCAILDIPVYKSRIQSLHVLFTLYSVFKGSPHFKHLAEENLMDNEEEVEANRLVIEQ